MNQWYLMKYNIILYNSLSHLESVNQAVFPISMSVSQMDLSLASAVCFLICCSFQLYSYNVFSLVGKKHELETNNLLFICMNRWISSIALTFSA